METPLQFRMVQTRDPHPFVCNAPAPRRRSLPRAAPSATGGTSCEQAPAPPARILQGCNPREPRWDPKSRSDRPTASWSTAARRIRRRPTPRRHGSPLPSSACSCAPSRRQPGTRRRPSSHCLEPRRCSKLSLPDLLLPSHEQAATLSPQCFAF
jgi:hypothetical protein